MKVSYIESVVKSLQKKIGKVITSKEIESLQKEILGSGFNENKFYKLIYTLKNKWHIVELKSGLYLISYPEAQNPDKEELKETHYRPLLHEIIKKEHKWFYYIWWIKWLELHMNNYAIPENIDIITQHPAGKKTIIGTAAMSIKPTITPKQLEKIIQYKTTKTVITWKSFFVWPLELCILELLYYQSKVGMGYEGELIKKAIKKHRSKIDLEFIKSIISSGRFHTSLNRLYELCKAVDKWLSNEILAIIKSSWFRIAV